MTNEIEPTRRHIHQLPGFWPCMVFALTLATHAVYVAEMANHPFFNYPLVDSETYHRQAVDMLENGWLGKKVFWQAPLYPYFLAFWYRFLDEPNRFFDIRVVQAFLAAINGVLLFALARRRVGLCVGLGAAGIAAFYAPLIYFDCEMLAPVVVVLAYLLLALALDRALEGGGIGWWAAAGALNGLATLAHGLAILIIPMVCLYALVRRPDPPQPFTRRVLSAFLYGLGALVLIAPVTVRNRVVGGEWVLISHNGPINLYIGNHPEYEKMVGLRPGLEWASLARAMNEQGIETASGEARHFIGATLDNIRRRPLGVARVWLKKLRLFFHADELKRNYPIYPVREHSVLMRVLLWKWPGPGGAIGIGFPFGLLLPLAVVGWWALRRQGVRLRAVELILAGHFAANMMFFICSRYRVAIAPFLAIYAAAAVAWAVREAIWTRASLRRHWGAIVAGLAVYLVGNCGLAPMNSPADRAEYSFYLGLVSMQRGETDEALAHYRVALENDPGYIEAHFALGVLYQDRLKQPEKALEQFDWVLDRDPGNMSVLYNKALSLASLGRFDDARAIAESLLEEAPDEAKYRRLIEFLSGKNTKSESENRTQGEGKPASLAPPTRPKRP